MKKGILTGIACLALVFSVTGCGEAEAEVRTIREVLVYDNIAEQFALEGEKVTIKNAVVNGSHGDVLTIALKDTYTTVEVVQKVANPDIKIRTTVDVTGTVETYHGHCRIKDATVTTVDETRLSVYVTTGMTTFKQFDTFGRTASSVLAMDVPLQIISFNGATEFKEGTDTVLITCYQGEDPTNPSNWIYFVVWGDTDPDTLNYLNTFFFGNDTGKVVTWDDPFKYEASHSEIAADWEGLGEGSIIKGLFHFYYDDVIDPDYGTMFYIDNICIPSLEGYYLYDEESDLTNLFESLSAANAEGNDETSSYTTHLVSEAYQADAIAKDETTGWVTEGDNLSPEFEDYLKSFTRVDYEEYYVRVCSSRFEILNPNYSYQTALVNYDYYNLVIDNYTDESSGETYCIELDFFNETSYNKYVENYAGTGTYDTEDEYITFENQYAFSWQEFINLRTLYDIADFGYSRSFHNNGATTKTYEDTEYSGDEYLVNDASLTGVLWDAATGAMTFGDYESKWSTYNLKVNDIFYAKDDNYLSINFGRDAGWYYNEDDPDTLFWSTYDWHCDIIIGDNTIGSTAKA